MNPGLQTFTTQDVRELMDSHRRAMAQPQQWGYVSADGDAAVVITRTTWEIPRLGFVASGWKVERLIRFPGGWVPHVNVEVVPTLAEAHRIARRIAGVAEMGGGQ